MRKAIMRIRIRIAMLLVPDFFDAAHDMCMIAMPLNNYSNDEYDKYHVKIADGNEYVAAWTSMMPYLYHILDRHSINMDSDG